MNVCQWLDSIKSELTEWSLDTVSFTAVKAFYHFQSKFPEGYRTRKADNPYWVAFKDFFQTVKGAS